MKDTKTTNILLLIIVIPLIFYLLKTLSFIFIPLISAMFIALLFLPFIRWMKKKRVPKPVSIFIVIIMLIGALKLSVELVQLSTHEIISSGGDFFAVAEVKIVSLVESIESFFGIERIEGDNILLHYSKKFNITENFGNTLNFIENTISVTLMTAFFVILLLSESINFQELLDTTIFRSKRASIRTFRQIEKEIIKFVGVKFIISLFTGLGFGLACYFFGVSFPIFWGIFAFAINFVQMIGSIISVVLLSIFALVELDPSGTLLMFIITITAVQAVMGGVLEPIFMGKTFSINVVTVLVMLMLWGYIWGIPGLIMSIPITVFIKIILSQFPKTQVIANLMAGSPPEVSQKWIDKVR